MNDVLSFFAPERRAALLIIAALLILGIATFDAVTKPYFSFGFLYLFPIMIIGGVLTRTQTIAVAVGCAVLGEVFGELPARETVVRLILSSAGLTGTGLLVTELLRQRDIAVTHATELEKQQQLRRGAEEELQFLVDTTPAAIIVVNSDGQVVLANDAARRLLESDLIDQPIDAYLPPLQAVIQTHSSRVLRTTLQCRGQRKSGEAFLAGIWFSTYTGAHGPRLAAIIVDLSEDLRSREDLSFDHLLRNTRVLMGAIAHEVRNVSSAAIVLHKNLSHVPGLSGNEDFRALGTLMQGLETIAGLELEPSLRVSTPVAALTPVFDDLRVLLEASFSESHMTIVWELPEGLPLVRAERHGLIQVLLNLAKNSHRAMLSTPTRRLRICAAHEGSTVTIRFEDTGVGVSAPERLFRPFERHAVSAGLGLYVSRAIVRSFGGDLVYEARESGSCFAILLATAPAEAFVNV